MRWESRREVATLKKLVKLTTLSTWDLERMYNVGRAPGAIRKTLLSRLLSSTLPPEFVEWSSQRSSVAMLNAAKLLQEYVVAPDDGTTIAALLDLLEDLADSHPKVLRSVVLPVVRALKSATARNDAAMAERLERFLLLVAGAAPTTLFGGVLVEGDWRFRSPAKRRSKRAGGQAKSKPYMISAIRRAAADFRDAFILPATQRLSRAGYKPMVDQLNLVMKALDCVIEAGSKPAAASR